MTTSPHRKLPRRARRGTFALATFLLGAALLGSRAAKAQTINCAGTGTFPCAYQIENAQIQPSPNLLKFQARISQAELPLGSAVFNAVTVNVNNATQTLCTENFTNVQVSSSVMNLEIGRNLSCELDQVVAANGDLYLQVCLGSATNCLRPITLGATPYALKSNFAVLAQAAYQAQIAGQANYAHRMSADADMLLTNQIATGYFDFQTPAQAQAANLFNQNDALEFQNGGFMLWTPLKEGSSPTLNIAAGSNSVTGPNVPQALGVLRLDALQTQTLNQLVVMAGGAQITGASTITGMTNINGALTVASPGVTGLNVTAGTNTSLGGTLAVTGTVTAQSDINASGNISAGQDLMAGGSMTAGGNVASGGTVTATGDISTGGSVTATGGITTGASLIATGGVTAGGDIAATGSLAGNALTIGSGSTTILTAGSTGTVINGSLTVNGMFSATAAPTLVGVPGNFTIPGFLTVGTTIATPTTNTIDGNLAITGSNSTITVGDNSTAAGTTSISAFGDIVAAGKIEGNTLTVGTGTTPDLVSDSTGTVINGNLTVNGTVTSSGGGGTLTGVSGNFAIGGNLSVNGTATFSGVTTFNGNVQVNGTLTQYSPNQGCFWAQTTTPQYNYCNGSSGEYVAAIQIGNYNGGVFQRDSGYVGVGYLVVDMYCCPL